MRKILAISALLVLGCALSAVAQVQPKTVARIVTIKVKPGMEQQFEQGLQRFHQWEQQQKLPFTNYTWVYVSGERTNQYVIGTFGHDWKDFDAVGKFAPAARQQILADVAPFVESGEISYYALRPDLTGSMLNPGQPPAAWSSITTFLLKPGSANDVEDAIKEAESAIKKSNWGTGKPCEWYSLVNGGEGPALVLACPADNWAGFQPPAKSLMQVLTEVYGKDRAQALDRKFDQGIRSERSEIIHYLPELSYIAASQ